MSNPATPASTPASGLRQRPGDQRLPASNDSPDIQSLVIADVETRRELGISRYGTALQAFNRRDALRDAYEEAVDCVMYIRQVMAERDGLWTESLIREQIVRALARSAGDSQADAVMAIIRSVLTAVAADQRDRYAALQAEIAALRGAK